MQKTLKTGSRAWVRQVMICRFKPFVNSVAQQSSTEPPHTRPPAEPTPLTSTKVCKK